MALAALSGLALLYTYALYPLLLFVMRRPDMPVDSPAVSSDLPRISVIVPFYNEEHWVSAKLENTLSWEYPPDRFEIIAVSDGSTDSTSHILSRYTPPVGIISHHPRRGKPTALNTAAEAARGEVLVFTDANVLIEPESIRAMLARYADPTIGGVSGNVTLQAEGSREPLGEGLYMRYERALYALESQCHTMVGADGAFWSVRRELFPLLKADTITDDFAAAMEIIARKKRMVYEPRAMGVEVVVPNVREEFIRKVRMIAGGYQTLWRYRKLLTPWRYPFAMFALLSHKVMRWMAPVFLVTLFASSFFAGSPWSMWSCIVGLQAAFYLLAALGWADSRLRQTRLVYLAYYFCAVNLAAFLGFWRFLFGRQAVTWQKASRASSL